MNLQTFEKNYTMTSLHKAVKILKAFSNNEPSLSLTELSKKTGITMSSLQRFVATFVYEGFLVKDERTKRYQLGLSLLYLGNLVKQESNLIVIAEPMLKRLNDDLGESISLNVIDAYERRCILNFDSTHSLSTRMLVGDTAPLYAGASSKTLLAFLPNRDEFINSIEFERITENTIISKETLRQQIEEIRLKGYAISQGERVKGAYSVTAPILDRYQSIIASVTIVIPEVRYKDYDENMLIEKIKAVAYDIEKQLWG